MCETTKDVTNFLLVYFDLKRTQETLSKRGAKLSGQVKFTLDGLERTVTLGDEMLSEALNKHSSR
jgi:hypothetical protein